MNNNAKFSNLVGKTLVEVRGQVEDDVVDFKTTDGGHYQLYHSQDCCEIVRIQDIAGDLEDLVGSPILFAEESSNEDEAPEGHNYCDDFHTWTFYRIGTVKGTVVIRWLGESNGYYAESVGFMEVSDGI